MKSLQKALYYLVVLISAASCAQKSSYSNSSYLTQGRVEVIDKDIILIGAGSSVTFSFTGNECEIALTQQNEFTNHGYISIELDGNYIGRKRVENTKTTINITATDKKKVHILKVFKATEAANGNIIFNGTTANLVKTPVEIKKKIEFIGNSITSGMGNDTKELPCGQGEWFDQHNAYWAYGPILSRKLNVDYLLSSVSGIGMYRNWNDENIEEAIMPDVYENLYLNKDTSKRYDFKFQPDIISICLGTNDLSEGDGTKPRLPFNEEKYVANYIQFVKTIYKHTPKAQIVLLNSPMVSGERNETLVKCLKQVIKAFENDKTHKEIKLFEYKSMNPKGCGSHPDIDDHKLMASELESFFKTILDEK